MHFARPLVIGPTRTLIDSSILGLLEIILMSQAQTLPYQAEPQALPHYTNLKLYLARPS